MKTVRVIFSLVATVVLLASSFVPALAAPDIAPEASFGYKCGADCLTVRLVPVTDPSLGNTMRWDITGVRDLSTATVMMTVSGVATNGAIVKKTINLRSQPAGEPGWNYGISEITVTVNNVPWKLALHPSVTKLSPSSKYNGCWTSTNAAALKSQKSDVYCFFSRY